MFIVYFYIFYSTVQHSVHPCCEECSINKALLTYLHITARSVVRALTKFFSIFGMPQFVQTDQGTHFKSTLFAQVLRMLNIKHVVSSAYHPESQGVLERWHQTLKSMLRKYCLETVMAFGMCNAPATFQRLVNTVLAGVVNCNAYLDDLIVYSVSWVDHLKTLRASLTLNLAKCEFGKGTVTYLCKQVGQGQVRPIEKVRAIKKFLVPTTRRELRRF